MQREQAIAILQSRAGEVQRSGATALYLFGSTARNQGHEHSDVDLFVDYDSETFSFVELIRLSECLSSALGVAADLTTRRALHPALRESIEREAIQIL
jgi:predicted nucleotidyltransferase